VKANHNIKRSTQVLRDTSLISQPHTLSRPGHAPINSFPLKNSQRLDSKLVPSLVSQSLAALPSKIEFVDRYQEGYANGKKEGDAQARIELKNQYETHLAADRKKIFEDAYQEGLNRGLRDATSKIDEQIRDEKLKFEQAFNERIKRIDQFFNDIPKKIEECYHDFEDDMLSICFATLTKLLGDIVVKPEVLISLIRQHIEKFSDEICQICLHPQDHQMLVATLKSTETGNGRAVFDLFSSGRLEFVADAEIKLGGIVLRSGRAKLDAQIDAQMISLRDILLRERNRSSDMTVLTQQSSTI